MAETGAAADLISSGKLLRGKRIYRRKNLMQTTKLLSVIGLVAAFLAFAPTRGAGDTPGHPSYRDPAVDRRCLRARASVSDEHPRQLRAKP